MIMNNNRTESACVSPSTIGGRKLTSKAFKPKPFKVDRFYQCGGKMVRIIPISTNIEGQKVTTIFSSENIEQSPKKGHSKINLQSKRMALLFLAMPDTDISAINLHRKGAESRTGFHRHHSAAVSSDLRAQGMNIVKSVDKIVSGQRQTAYRYVKDVELYQ